MNANSTVTIHPADEGGWGARCAEVPEANGQGEKREDAIQHLDEAISLIMGNEMLHQIESEAIWFREAARLAITTRHAIIVWADSKIAQLDRPPYWLIELSTLQSKDLHEYASIIEASVTAKLPVNDLVSLVLEAHARKSISFDQAIALLCRIFFPKDKSLRTEFPDSIADLLVELDCMEIDGPLSEDFVSRCISAFRNHLNRHPSPPSAIFRLPSTI